MEPVDHLHLLRRRRGLIIALTVIGLFFGFLIAPKGDEPTVYNATHTLLIGAGTGDVGLSQAALLVKVGEVPDRVAQRLGIENDPALTRRIVATTDSDAGALAISAISNDPNQAELLANAFAEELLAVVGGDGAQGLDRTRQDLLSRIGELGVELSDIDAEIASADAESLDTDDLVASRTSVDTQVRLTLEELAELEARTAPLANLRTVERAEAQPVIEEGLQAPDSLAALMAILGLMGLALGVGLAFLVERIDTRLRAKETVEQALGLPVLAEIPLMPRAARHRDQLLSLTAPSSPYVEAHRSIRSVLLFNWAGHEAPSGGERSGGGNRVLLVVSPGPGEGKTATVAHLAAAFAEIGKSVLIISADFRRPRVHALFDVDEAPGLSDVVLKGTTDDQLIQGVHDTNVEGVRLIPSGSPSDNPAELLVVTQRLMRSAREVVDVVLVDSPPLLVVNDAIELSGAADAVLLLIRAGRTSEESAERAAEMLRLVDAPVVGSVLVGADETPTGSYYRSQYSHYYSRTAPISMRQGMVRRARHWLERGRHSTSSAETLQDVDTQSSQRTQRRKAASLDAIDSEDDAFLTQADEEPTKVNGHAPRGGTQNAKRMQEEKASSGSGGRRRYRR